MVNKQKHSTPDTLCTICGRVRWGAWVQLPFGKWRHDECALGSEAWREYYQGLSKVDRQVVGEYYQFSYEQREEGHAYSKNTD